MPEVPQVSFTSIAPLEIVAPPNAEVSVGAVDDQLYAVAQRLARVIEELVEIQEDVDEGRQKLAQLADGSPRLLGLAIALDTQGTRTGVCDKNTLISVRDGLFEYLTDTGYQIHD
jgi:hypothetical protein